MYFCHTPRSTFKEKKYRTVTQRFTVKKNWTSEAYRIHLTSFPCVQKHIVLKEKTVSNELGRTENNLSFDLLAQKSFKTFILFHQYVIS